MTFEFVADDGIERDEKLRAFLKQFSRKTRLYPGAPAELNILGYLEAIPPGTNRRSHYKTLRKLWRWAFDLGHVENDPMSRLKPLDAWGVNNEVLSVELFQRFLRITQGLEDPRDGVESSAKYKPLLPYFVLGGTPRVKDLRNGERTRRLSGH